MAIKSPPRVSARPCGLIDIEESRTSGVGENSIGKCSGLMILFLCGSVSTIFSTWFENKFDTQMVFLKDCFEKNN